MPKHVGSKFRTKNKFGKSKKRRRKVVLIAKSPEIEEEVRASTSHDSTPTPSTSTTTTTRDSSVCSEPTKSVTSKRKMEYFENKMSNKKQQHEDVSSDDDRSETEVEDKSGNIIASIDSLTSIVSSAACPNCHEQKLTFLEEQTKRMGSASHLVLMCDDCGQLSEGKTSSKIGKGFEVNKRVVSAATMAGIGFTQLERFFGLMNLPPPMHLKTWQHHRGTLHHGATRAADLHLQEAAEQVRQTYAEMNLGNLSPEGTLDISVSFDGSWQKRGRTSHNGIATVIELFTGLVIDYVTLSNYCHACEIGPQPDSDGYDQWFDSHRPECQKTIECSSGAMEKEAALILFGRSQELHNFRYTEMLSDGDAKTHAALLEAGYYDVKKTDCTNHVSKRMGTGLRNLVEKSKAQKKPISGRGKLTEVRIKKLTNYYGRAIKDNAGNLEAMEQAVWASFFHTLSTDEDPHHRRCPAGEESWCFWQRALALGEPPRPHSQPLPRDIGDALVPLYKRLGDPQLLERCLSGKTSNSNEAFHSTVWRTCPKERWASYRTVDTAVAVCVQKFNKGSSALLDVLCELNIVSGRYAEEHVMKLDERRARSANRKCTNRATKRRETIERAKRAENQNRRAQEGVVYAAGQF